MASLQTRVRKIQREAGWSAQVVDALAFRFLELSDPALKDKFVAALYDVAKAQREGKT